MQPKTTPIGARGGARGAIVAALRLAGRPLTTPEIRAAVPLSRTALFYQLERLERDGVIAPLPDWKRPRCWRLTGVREGRRAA